MVLLCMYDDDIYISYKERSQLRQRAILTMFIRKNKYNKLYKKIDSLSLRNNVEIYVFVKFFIWGGGGGLLGYKDIYYIPVARPST
jgi:hypothetical protein